MKKLLEKKLENNIWKFAIHLITNKRAYMPFLSIYLMTMPGATEQFIGVLTSIGQMVGLALEIPSGYISDRIGHKRSLVLARVFIALSTASYLFADEKFWFILGAVFLAIGFSFTSGTSSAFMHDTLRALGRDSEYSKIMGRIKSIGFAVPVLFILSLSYLADIDFKLAFIGALLIDIFGLLAVSLLKQPKSIDEEEISEESSDRFALVKKWFSLGWVPFVIFASLSFGIVFAATAGFKNTYQESLGFSIFMIGILWGVARSFVSLVVLLNNFVYKKLSFRQFLLGQTFLFSLGFIALFLFPYKWITAGIFIVLNILMWGFGVSRSNYLLDFIGSSKRKATFLSINHFIQNAIVSLLGFVMGFMVHRYSYQKAFLFVGITLAVVTFLFLFLLPKEDQKKSHSV